jgi:hypothetical protein
MRRGAFSVALLVGALLVAGVATAGAGAPSQKRLAPPERAFAPTRAAAGTASFADKAGDGGVAPDVTAVSVSNDDEGMITFRITVPNRSALGPDDVLAIPLGTDDPDFLRGQRNDGANFILGLEAQGAFLLEWNGTEMDQVEPNPSSLTGSFSGGVATITVNQEDLAPGFPDMSVPIAMDFYVLGIAFSGSDVVAQDDAPDGTDIWNYKIASAMRVIVTSFDADKTIKAGKTLVVLMGAAHGDTGAAVTVGKIACTARLGGKALKGTGSFLNITLTSPTTGRSIQSPNITCSWKVPKKKSKGKTIRGSVALTESGITVTQSFTTRVR